METQKEKRFHVKIMQKEVLGNDNQEKNILEPETQRFSENQIAYIKKEIKSS